MSFSVPSPAGKRFVIVRERLPPFRLRDYTNVWLRSIVLEVLQRVHLLRDSVSTIVYIRWALGVYLPELYPCPAKAARRRAHLPFKKECDVHVDVLVYFES